MTDVLRIKRRTSGSPGSPTSLANAELAYNEVDHILYYGEGTGGGGGTASVIVPIGGQGLAEAVNLPLMDATTALTGSRSTWSRSDHVHPTDTSRAPTASPTFTGVVTVSGTITGAGMTAFAAAPPPIGSTTANTGAFSTLSASGVVSGAGFTTLLAPYALTSSLPAASTTLPLINAATAVIGSLNTYAKADHVHPTDTTRAALVSPAFTGTPTAPTATAGNSSTQLATTAFVAVSFAPLASPNFTGVPTAPTQANGTAASTQLATSAYVNALRQDQQAVPIAAVSWNNQLLTNLGNPVSAQDAATKSYVDQNATGLSAKSAVAVATTGSNIALTGGFPVIDGYTCVVNDRVLVKDQTLPQNNGIYVATSTAWLRATDMDAWAEVPQAYVFVTNGTLNSNSSWVSNAPVTGTLGTTPITWVQFSQQAQIAAGNGLTRTGNTIDVVGTAARIAVFADSIDIDAAYVGQTSITTLGAIATGTWNGTTIAVARGGTGAATLTGYIKGTGTSPFTALATIPSTDITGLGSMSVQNANAVAVTGGTIDGVTFDCGNF